MNPPDVSCEIHAYCSINPSEDHKKVEQAISNILFDVDVKIINGSLHATSKSLESIKKIYEAIHSHRSKNSYRHQLNQNLRNDSSWFYLNKQAAFVNTIALCSESEESPLGPIKIVLSSKDIDTIMEWLVF